MTRDPTDDSNMFPGAVFNRWTVVGPAASAHAACRRCRCECGTGSDVGVRLLRSGLSRSCGCITHEFTSGRTGARTNHASKLPIELREEILRRWTRGEATDALARAYGVRRSVVTAIVRGRV